MPPQPARRASQLAGLVSPGRHGPGWGPDSLPTSLARTDADPMDRRNGIQLSRILTRGLVAADELSWHRLGYQHTHALREDLAERYRPATAQSALGGPKCPSDGRTYSLGGTGPATLTRFTADRGRSGARTAGRDTVTRGPGSLSDLLVRVGAVRGSGARKRGGAIGSPMVCPRTALGAYEAS
jgi:hypothetical protein